MNRKLLAVALCLALLTSCAPLGAGTEELLLAPRLNQRQTEVYEALEATLDMNTVLYKYPQRGDHRSPFVFYDLDGDGNQEAIVFYTTADDEENVRAKILMEEGQGQWTSFYDLSGIGDQIDFIEFSNILSDDWQCMLIGWQNTRRGTATLGIYSFQDGKFRREAEHSYHSYTVDDFVGDSLREIALITLDASDTYHLYLLGRASDGRLSTLGDMALSADVNTILQMRCGKLWNNTRAVYVDELRTDTYIATEVIQVHAQGLDLVVGESADYYNYNATFRQEELLSVELYDDGVVHIPTVTQMMTPQGGEEMASPPLIAYITVQQDSFAISTCAVRNEDAGYIVYFPDEWVGQVTVVRRPESAEWRFHKLDANYDAVGSELLRIQVYSTRDYRDQFSEDYFLLAEKGVFQYYGYVPRTVGEPLAITEDEARALFSLI